MEANDPQGVANLDTKGIVWDDLCRGSLDITIY